MAKLKSVYICQSCGGEQPKWSGQCGSCGKWNSLVETLRQAQGKLGSNLSRRSEAGKTQTLGELEKKKTKFERMEVGSGEMSQVLGGGLVKGSVVLLAGEPGIGKSTLLTQLALYFASKHGKVLYVCGEESVEQVKLRLKRISVHKKTSKKAKDNILLMSEIDTDRVVATIEAEKPMLTIVDSIQTLTTGDLSGMAGSVGQVRESGNRLLNIAKSSDLSVFLVGHVTKAGSVAGPKILEHMVDSVLYLTGERSGRLRILRAVKNRFGAVDEVGVFDMSDAGLTEVKDPARAFLEESQSGVPGSCITVVMEGTRPIMAEIQALVVESNLTNARRVVSGVKLSRVQLLCAVLQKRIGVRLHDRDVFVSVAGGLSVNEPAADLAIALAIVSSAREKALPKGVAAIGEVGLLGEIRRVSFMERRVKEAKKLGYGRVLPGKNEKGLGSVVRGLMK